MFELLQKQYIFLYRALLDVAQFGNTEIPLKDLNTTVEQLKQRSNDSRDQCKLEIEFEVRRSHHTHDLWSIPKSALRGKITIFSIFSIFFCRKSILFWMNPIRIVRLDRVKKTVPKIEVIVWFHLIEIVSFSHQSVRKWIHWITLTYYIRIDNNLFGVVGPQPSTYINATFIEGYDHSESFIITQDPMEETIGDFWRMISEQSINTIVMISEVKIILHEKKPSFSSNSDKILTKPYHL